MPVNLDVRGTDQVVTLARQRSAGRVLREFAGHFSDFRLLIVLDDQDAITLKAGNDNRGSFRPISGEYYLQTLWPRYIALQLRSNISGRYEATYHYDGLIYLHNSTCEDEASLTMTLAHELQHAVQYDTDRKTWAWNIVAQSLPEDVRSHLRFVWHDLPIEYEARIVAKHITLKLLGEQRTGAYISSRQGQAKTTLDTIDWDFIRNVDAAEAYDLRAETTTLFQNKLASVSDEVVKTFARLSGKDFKHLRLQEMVPFAQQNPAGFE